MPDPRTEAHAGSYHNIMRLRGEKSQHLAEKSLNN